MLFVPDVDKSKILLCVTDAAPYMKCAMNGLSSLLYPKMIYLTCIVHGLHRVAEFIREQFDVVNKLIANVKKAFVKAPQRKISFKSMHPNLPYLPQPVVTRWGTWLEAAIYYADYFDEINNFFATLYSKDAKSIRKAKLAIQAPNIKNDLSFIKTNFSCILQLETAKLPIVDAIEIVDSVYTKLGTIRNRTEFEQKLDRTIQKNKGFLILKHVSQILAGQNHDQSNEFVANMSPHEIAAL